MPFSILLPLKDHLRHSPRVRRAAAYLFYGAALLCRRRLKRWQRYCRAAELGESPGLVKRISRRLEEEKAFERPDIWREMVRAIPQVSHQLNHHPALNRSIVLKAPGPNGEKGVFLIYFEYNLAKFLVGLEPEALARLADRYHFVLAACWSPTYYAVLGLAMCLLKDGLFIQPANDQDEALFRAFHNRLRPTDSMGGSWINPERFDPGPIRERPIDFIMVANWGSFKRHWDFFRALRHLSPSLKVVLIGQKEGGRDVEFIRRLAKEYGVPQQIEYYQSLPIDEVVRHLQRAKVSLIFSRREGVCVASVESLFAGCALGMRGDAHIGSVKFIGPETGVRLRPGSIVEDLQQLLAVAPTLNPACWAIENISHTVTHRKLNEQIKAYDRSLKRPWTRPLCLPEWRPYARYSREEERLAMQPVLQELAGEYPGLFSGLVKDFQRG